MSIIDPESPEVQSPAPDECPELVPRITADDLVATVEQNALHAEQEFAGQWLEVEGLVGTVRRGKAGDPMIYIPGSVFGTVACSFAEGHMEELAGLRRGDRVVVEGKVADGRIGLTVRLNQCVIVEIDGVPDGGWPVGGGGPGGGGPGGRLTLVRSAA